MTCVSLEVFLKHVQEFNEVGINEDSEKTLRFPIWGVKPSDVSSMVHSKSSDAVPGRESSKHVLSKLNKTLANVIATLDGLSSNGIALTKKFETDLVGESGVADPDAIKKSIAMHEVMEAIKGEADKARNNNIDLSEISDATGLPGLPLSRLAAIIGRKIMYANKARFKSMDGSKKSAVEIESMYYAQGLSAIRQLEASGYVKTHEGSPTMRDYTDSELKADIYDTKVKVVVKARSVSLQPAAFGIEKFVKGPDGNPTDVITQEMSYFLNRTASDIKGSALGAMTGILSAVRQITQPSNLTFPDTGNPNADRALADSNPLGIVPSPSTSAASQKLYNNPLYVNTRVHKLLTMLKEATEGKSTESASEIIMKAFGKAPLIAQSLFGIKNSDNFSVDRKESTSGQNLSKTVPLDDIVDTYSILTDGKGEPVGMHMVMRGGRNLRLYYDNSVMNAHGSKQSRHMMNTGAQTLEFDTEDFHRIVSTINDTLGDSDLTYTDIVSGGNPKLDKALKLLASYEVASELPFALKAIASMSKVYPGKDYPTLLSVLGGVSDIRKAKEAGSGTVTTEFMDHADATAQGATLTFQQAIGTMSKVMEFMQRIGLVSDTDGSLASGTLTALDDVYGLMSEGLSKYIADERTGSLTSRVMVDDEGQGNVAELLQTTLDKLFGTSKKGEREFSKYSTMPFVYGQGEGGAVASMSESIANNIIDSLGNEGTRQYLSILLDDKSYADSTPSVLNSEVGLYRKIKDKLKEKGIPQKLFQIMEVEINELYLKDYKDDAKAIWKLVEGIENNHNMKVLPLGAVLDGIGIDQVSKYGMTLAKIVEVSSPIPGDVDQALVKEGGHTVLTRMQKLYQSIMDVSVTHGIDSGLIYHAINEVMGDSGAIVVHDQVIGSVKLVREVVEAYVRLNARLISEYDVHQQMLYSIAHYSPETSNTQSYKDLKTKIDARVAVKKKLVSSGTLNKYTDALIGNGNKAKEFAKGQYTKEPTTKSVKASGTKTYGLTDRFEEAGTSLDAGNKPNKVATPVESGKDQTPLLRSLASDSPLIQRFLQTSEKPAISGSRNKFDTENNQVVISGTDAGRGEGKTLGRADRQLQIELIEHEIVHHNTAAYIAKALKGGDKDTARDMAYFNKVIPLLGQLADEAGDTLSDETGERIAYIMFSGSTAVQVSEFVSIMSAEPSVAAEIYKLLGGTPTKTLKSRIADFIARVKSALLSDKDLAADINTDKLQDALVRTLENGRSFKEDQRAEAIAHEKGYGALYAGPGSMNTIRYLNSAVAAMINSKVERNGKRLLGTVHENMVTRFPLYSDAVNGMKGLYDGSEAMQNIMHTITGEGTSKSRKADLLAQASKIQMEHDSSIAHQRSEFKKALAGIDGETKKTIGRFVTQLPLHEYFTFLSEFDTAAKIDAEVTVLEGSVSSSAISDVDQLIERNVKGKEGGSLYNLGSKYDVDGSDVSKLLALKSIQKIGSKEFETLLGNADLISLIKDNVIANKISLIDIKGTDNLRDSLLPDYWKETQQMQAVSIKDVKRLMNDEESGWIVLREPTKSTLGIAYKQLVDSTDIKGAYTDIKLQSADVDVFGKDRREYSNVVKASADSFKLVLTPEEKAKIGLEENFVEALVRGTAHSMAIKDSQSIRDAMLMAENRFVATSESKLVDLVDILKSDNVDAPWFVKLDNDQTYSSLDRKIRAKYKQVSGRVSDVEGADGSRFSDEVHLVRKDLSHILVGGNYSSLFKNKRMQWVVRITKDIMAGTKIGMVVLNPLKIAKDMVSNVSYLSVSGASPKFIAKNFRDISRDYHTYQNLVHEMVQMKVRLAAEPGNKVATEKLESLQKRIDANPVGDLAHKGFINSLGSDLVAKSSDVSSGLQNDMQTALEYMLKNKKGNKNIVGHFLNQLHKVGFQSEDFIKYLGGIVGKAKDGKQAEQFMESAAARIKEIKTEEDIVAYVSQYTTSPGSELVRLGSSTTDLVDVLAKETLYRHAMQNEGMSAEAARIHVLDSFPDYKENLPLAIKQLSDVGIIMFPSFWLRIQKAIYRMVRDKPVNLSTELLLEEYVTGNVGTIFDANIISKYESFWGIVHTPLESSGFNSVFPTNILNGL